jgi:hypothetical protein
MFTVKFYRFPQGAEVLHSVSCIHYSSYVDTVNKVTIITVYPGPTIQNGIEWHLSDRTSDSFTACYIENQTGKTIDSYNVFSPDRKPKEETGYANNQR